MPEVIDVEAIIEENAAGRADLMQAIDALPEARRVEAGVVESWSVKDLIAHIAAWQDLAADAVERLSRGEPPFPEEQWVGTDPFNAQVAAEHAADRWEDVMASLRRSRERYEAAARAAAAALPAERLAPDRTTARMLLGNGHVHDREHAEQIMAWRRDQGL